MAAMRPPLTSTSTGAESASESPSKMRTSSNRTAGGADAAPRGATSMGRAVWQAKSSAAAAASRLPDTNALSRREVELLPGLDQEGLVPGVLVAHGVRAILGRRVPVGDDALPQRGLAELRAPALRVAD